MFIPFKESVNLLWINLKVKFYNFIEFFRVVARYYPNIKFFKVDSFLLFSYLFRSPFKESKQFSLEKGMSDIYTYGETPLTTLDLISKKCAITTADVILELGCGRGRTCFWLNQFIGCRVIGIDYVPIFIQNAKKICSRFSLEGITFRLENLFHADLSGATVIYLYGTCFTAQEIGVLIERFSYLPTGTKIITVSYALTEYQPKAPFQIEKQFPASFTWGKADVFLQVKCHSI